MNSNIVENSPFIRLPKYGTKCPVTGLSRSTLTAILRTGRVKSHSLKLPGKSRGARVIDTASLLEYIRQCPSKPVAQKGGWQ